MMNFPDGLVKKTKKLFPDATHLHEALENCDAAVVMDCLKELAIPITNITNEWLIVVLKNSRGN